MNKNILRKEEMQITYLVKQPKKAYQWNEK